MQQEKLKGKKTGHKKHVSFLHNVKIFVGTPQVLDKTMASKESETQVTKSFPSQGDQIWRRTQHNQIAP